MTPANDEEVPKEDDWPTIRHELGLMRVERSGLHPDQVDLDDAWDEYDAWADVVFAPRKKSKVCPKMTES